MIIVEEKKNRVRIDISVPQEALIEFRKVLFENGLSVQEFIAFLFISTQLKEPTILNLIELAKLAKINNNENVEMKHKPSSSNALYNLLERRSPINQQR